MATKTARTTIVSRVPTSLAQGRLDAERVDATTGADIAAQQAADALKTQAAMDTLFKRV